MNKPSKEWQQVKHATLDRVRSQLDGAMNPVTMAFIASCTVYLAGLSCSEIYLEKAFDGTGWRPEQSLPVAKELGETSLMFLVHPTLSRENVEDAVAAIRDVLSVATR